jgi:hypothetical protein
MNTDCILLVRQGCGFSSDQFRRHADVFRIRAAAREIADIAEDLIAYAEIGDVFMHRINAARQVPSQDHRPDEPAFRLSLADLIVDGVEGDGPDIDPDFALADFRYRQIRRREIVGAAE